MSQFDSGDGKPYETLAALAAAKPYTPPTRWQYARKELRILLRDGPIGYVRGRRQLARFHDACAEAARTDPFWRDDV